MRPRNLKPTQMFAIAALFFYAVFFVVSQSFYSDSDDKLATLLSWVHYGAVLPRMLLWYVSIGTMSTLVIGLLAVALNRRWGRWVVLAATLVAFLIVPFSGVSVFAASARFIGNIAMICVFSILAIAFLPASRNDDL
jgi:hypothetical protein